MDVLQYVLDIVIVGKSANSVDIYLLRQRILRYLADSFKLKLVYYIKIPLKTATIAIAIRNQKSKLIRISP